MKINSAFLALATVFTLSLNLEGVTGRVLDDRLLIRDVSLSIPSSVDTWGLAGGSKGGKSDKGKDKGKGKGKGHGHGTTSPGGSSSSSSSGSKTAADRELDGFGLKRVDKGRSRNEGAFASFVPTQDREWKQWSIEAKSSKKATYGSKPILQCQTYSFSDGKGSLNTKWVETTNRHLPLAVNRRNLIRNTWLHANGDLGRLMVLGDSEIINQEVRQSIDDALALRGYDSGNIAGRVTFTPDSPGWDEIQSNAFIAGYKRMLNEDPSGFKNAKIANIAALMDENGNYHLLTGLERPKRRATPPGAPPPKRPETAEDSLSEGEA
ncbi:hypothetical protein M426DRAFT_25054 [Hypoxylon sp. CI-4A]|nr:hypothetical protein M426DRAFT_25054 [Hypoxylon sp. CI-4A]